MTTATPAATQFSLLTSLEEICSFYPCNEGWETLLAAHNKEEEDDVMFPLVQTVDSNSISDVCWLLGKLGHVTALVEFAEECAASVQYLQSAPGQFKSSFYAKRAMAQAALYDAASLSFCRDSRDAAEAVAEYAALTASASNVAVEHSLLVARNAVQAAAHSVSEAINANSFSAASAAIVEQREKNKQFLRDAILAIPPMPV